jgi:hypothetical protein
MTTGIVRGSSRDRRRQLVATFPELRARIGDIMVTSGQLVESAVAARSPGQTGLSDRARAQMLLSLAILRFAAQTNPDLLDNANSTTVAEAVTAFRAALRNDEILPADP